MKCFPLLISLAATVVWQLPVVGPFTAPAGASIITTGDVDPGGAATQSDPWAVGGNLYVGTWSSGTLNVTDGGLVFNADGYIARAEGTTGVATVTGSGSQWNNSEDLYVGYGGSGMLNVEVGGVVSNITGHIGHESGSAGTATVSGSGSQWNNSEDLRVGREGTGTLNIENAGVVSNGGSGILGPGSGSLGVVTVTGSGSQWNSGSLGHHDIWVGFEGGGGTLNIENGGVVSNGQGGHIGNGSGSLGVVTVSGSGSQWNNSGLLAVGYGVPSGEGDGSGTLNIEAGGVVSNTGGSIGHFRNSTGVATVTGSGSQWNNSQGLSVGFGGTGMLNVEAGGLVSNTYGGYVGYSSGSTGMATITGAGSRWNNAGSLYVGREGSGILNIEAGGVVSTTMFGSSSGDGYIGGHLGSTGEVTVTGADSQQNTSSSLHFGGMLHIGGNGMGTGGSGTLNLDNKGLGTVVDTIKLYSTGTINLVGGSLTTGSFDNSDGGTLNFHDGTLTVNGAGGVFDPGTTDFTIDGDAADDTPHLVIANTAGVTLSDSLYLGWDRQGALTVESGSVVSNTEGYIGYDSGSTGVATVTGTGSRWNNFGLLHVGWYGDGTLNVKAGGVVFNTTGYIGRYSSSTGEVTVTGSDSQWNNSGNLDVGYSGTGTLNVESGGVVSNTHGYLGHEIGSTGVATVTGSGSQWNNSSALYVGYKGTGTLNIENAGVVSNTTGYIGDNFGSMGIVTVTGAGSQWNNSGVLNVGFRSTGALNVTDGGVVSNASYSVIGHHSGSKGVATVTGSNSQWNSSGLLVGYQGSGTLNIEAGGVVSNEDNGYLGDNFGSTGIATVTGAESQWTNSNSLYIGGSRLEAGGSGTLNIDDSGLVTVSGTTKLWSGGTVNLNGGTLDVGVLDLTLGTFNMLDGLLHADSVVDDLNNQGGTLAPGQSPGILTVTDDYVQGAAATLEIELGGTVRGDEYDALIVNGNLTLNGRLDVLPIDGFVPQAGDLFDILDFEPANLSGLFDVVNLPALTSDMEWDLADLYTTGELLVSLSQIAGDFDSDGDVDGDDFLLWQINFPVLDGTAGSSSGDANGDGNVDGDDFLVWQRNFTYPTAISSVPEPNSLVLLALGGLMMLRRRRT